MLDSPIYPQTKPFSLSLTLGHVGLGIILLIAGIFRLINIGETPLSPDEASQALHVWRFWSSSAANIPFAGSPAYFTPTALLTQILGDSDGVMRLAPALFGWAAVGTPWLLRRRLGEVGALTAAILLAISPTAVSASRTAGGDSAAMFALLLSLIAFIRYLDAADAKWLIIAAAGIGLGLTTAPQFYSGLLILAAGWGISRWIGPELVEMPLGISASARRNAYLFGGAIFFVLATMAFLHPAGLGGAANNLGEWLSRFGVSSDPMELIAPILVFGRYEPILLFVGGVAGIWGTWKGRPLPSFLIYALIVGIVLFFAQPGTVANTLALTPWAALLVGFFVSEALKLPLAPGVEKGMREAAILAQTLVGAAFVGMIARQTKVALYNPDDFAHFWIAMGLLAVGGAVFLILFTFDKNLAFQAGLGAALILLGAFSWGNSWWLNHRAANDTRTQWVAVATDHDVRFLEETVRETAWQWLGSEAEASLLSTVDTPVLRWYLRDFPQAQFGESGLPAADHHLIITPTDVELPMENQYLGSDFKLIRNDLDVPLSSRQTAAYLLFWEIPAGINATSIILWVKEDIIIRP